MPIWPETRLFPRRRLLLGLLVWGVFVLVSLGWPRYFAYPAVIHCILLWAPTLIVGPAFGYLLRSDLERPGWRGKLFLAQTQLEFPAALLLLGAFSLPSGAGAAALVLPWLLLTLSLAFQGGLLLLERWLYAEEWALSLALLFLPVGAVWMLASRLGLALAGFPPVIVILTAVHFHFAGFSACLVLGASGRLLMPVASERVRRLFVLSVVGALLGIPLLALGILAFPLLELCSALVFAVSLWLWALLCAGCLWPQLRTQKKPVWVQGLLGVAVLSIWVSMAWAVFYALGAFGLIPGPAILTMVAWHGVLNAFGFASCALLVLVWLHPPARQAFAAIPFSRFWSPGFVGPQFFQRQGWVPELVKADAPRGLIDDLDSFARPDLVTQTMPPAIRHFYEMTQDHALRVRPEWQWGFRLGGRLFRALMNRIGQMALPVAAERTEDLIDSRILPLNSECDGRQQVRAWVRTYAETQQAVYAAAYSQHQRAGQTFMNIAFPLPGGNLTSILRLDWQGRTLSLSSLSEAKIRRLLQHEEQQRGARAKMTGSEPQKTASVQVRDQGVYLVFAGCVWRLPINESIYVWAREDVSNWPFELPAETTVLARHDMWFLGLLCLRLYYTIYPESTPSPNENSGQNSGAKK